MSTYTEKYVCYTFYNITYIKMLEVNLALCVGM